MVNYPDLKIKDSFPISGRGLMFIVDLEANGLCEGRWTREIPFSVGETLLNGGDKYIITSI